MNTPAQVLDCFLRTEMDVLCAGPFLIVNGEDSRVSGKRRAFAVSAAGADDCFPSPCRDKLCFCAVR
jgi:hypothetical protein